jgi:hypothetical protein
MKTVIATIAVTVIFYPIFRDWLEYRKLKRERLNRTKQLCREIIKNRKNVIN